MESLNKCSSGSNRFSVISTCRCRRVGPEAAQTGKLAGLQQSGFGLGSSSRFESDGSFYKIRENKRGRGQ
ncbi:hypothetical protein AAHA92_03606 [Salvia divinorum]|uniref:Uncharacterized protein n=1 Tax=Salvia divinorum TaxID=28513 RepID=A0ABD1IKC3_SALDI